MTFGTGLHDVVATVCRLERVGGIPDMLKFCFIFVIFVGASTLAARADEPRPNIVFILADDLGINDLSCYGRKDQSTPHLDRLAREGWRFVDACTAQPICSASRAALMTGKHPARLHLTTYLPGRADAPSQKLLQPVIEGRLPLEETTLPEVLKRAGYATACLGKWHLGGPGFGPAEQGFDTVVAGSARTTPSEHEGSKGEFELAAAAEAFIEAHRDRPFFLYLSHNSPHIPFEATPERIEAHKDAWHPAYAAVVESLDASVGRVLAKLDATGLAARTLVVFTSDNGGLHVPEGGLPPPTHNTPFRAGKGFLYEGGLRVPLIMRWPGKLAPGVVSPRDVGLADMAPTLIEAAGVEVATTLGPLDGVSLLPLFRGEDPAARDHFWHFPHYTNQGGRPASAVRHGQWKLIEHLEDGSAELFDLRADPGESTDLAAAQPDIVRDLRDRLHAWRERIGAQPCRPNPEFDAAAHAALYVTTDVSRLPPVTSAAELAGRWAAWRRGMDAAAKGPSSSLTPATGQIRLPASQARTHGQVLRYEPEPHKNTLGYWTRVEDWASWDFSVPSAGRYEIEIQQGCGGRNGGSDVEIHVAGQILPFTVVETGHFQQFIQRVIGVVDLPAGEHTLAVKPVRKARDAVMDLRSVVLRPVPAGGS